MGKLYFRLLTLVLFVISSNEMKSTGHGAGHISYRLIDTNTGKYRFRLEVYRECVAITFGGMNLEIRKIGFSGSVPMNIVSSDIEITPISYPPDVLFKPTTNCPSGAVIGTNPPGMIKTVYELDYVMGKNQGWVYVAQTSCCRSNNNTIAGASSSNYWIQAAINTNIQNSSPILNSPDLSYWGSGVLNNYSIGAEDKYDPKYIDINGVLIKRDSFAYQLITPFNGEATNPTNVVNLQNPSATFNSGLSAQNFLYTTNGVTLNQETGTISCTPSYTQSAIMAFVIKEYRAIPNANGIGYTREYVGHTMKDITWTVYTNPGDIVNKGIVKDSSTIETLINSYSAKTCKLKDNKIVIKVVGSSLNDMKLKENSNIDTSVIGNYSVNSSKTTIGNVDTMFITLRFDRKKNVQYYDFLYRVFYTTAIGYQVERFIPIRLYFNGSTYNLNQDTVTYCVGSTQSLKLANPIKTKVSWSPKTNIVSAEAEDSSWINVLPSASRWYYVNNLSSNQGCKINDSIFVNVDTCSTISGYMYIDKNNNCVKDTNELVLGNDSLEISGISNGFTTTASTDNNGFYSFSPPPNSTYKIKVLGKSKVCNSATNELTVSVLNSNFNLHIGVKDSVKIDPPIFQFETKNLCISETNNVQLSINKSFGNLKAIIRVGTIDSAIIDLNKSEGTYQINQNFTAKKSGIHSVNISFYNSQNQVVSTQNIQSIMVNSCYVGRFYGDADSSCTYILGENPSVSSLLQVKDLTNNQTYNFTTDNQGKFKIIYQKNTNYQLVALGLFTCLNDTNQVTLPFITKDTFISEDFALKKINDSTDITNESFVLSKTEYCINDTMHYKLQFNKGAGGVKAIFRYGNGDSFVSYFSSIQSQIVIENDYIYSKSGNYRLSVELFNNYGFNIYSKSYTFVSINSCILAKFYNDTDSNCIYNNDFDLTNISLNIKNTTTGLTTNYITDNKGIIKFKVDKNTNYKLSIYGFFNCLNLFNEISLPVIQKDTMLNIDYSFKKMDNASTIQNILFSSNQNLICYNDTLRYKLKFTQNTSGIKVVIHRGDGSSYESDYSLSNTNIEINDKYLYSQTGKYQMYFEIFNIYGYKIYSQNLSLIDFKACVRGNIFIDLDTNCNFTPLDVIVKNHKVRLYETATGIDKYYFTDLNGNYRIPINSNQNYKLFIDQFINCTLNNKSIEILNSSVNTNFNFNIPIDLSKFNYHPVAIYSGWPNNLTTNHIYLTTNAYTFDTREKNFIVKLPKNSKNIEVIGSKSFVLTGKELSIIQDSNKIITIKLKFDSVLIDSIYKFDFELSQVSIYDSVNDNKVILNREGRTSYDPNNKLVAINSIQENGDFTNKNDKLHFVINFQNTGNFTAKDIFILDKLDPKLDLTTFEIGNSSHPMTVSLDDNRQVKFDFKNILLPDSFANEPASHGWVSYVIKPLQSLAENDVIKNYADIYFDYNAPVMTNQTMNKYIIKSANGNSSLISKTKDIITIYPNPASDFINIEHPNSKEYSVQLFSIDGRFIAKFDSPKSIDIRSLTKGTYQVHITADKDITIQKIQVQ